MVTRVRTSLACFVETRYGTGVGNWEKVEGFSGIGLVVDEAAVGVGAGGTNGVGVGSG